MSVHVFYGWLANISAKMCLHCYCEHFTKVIKAFSNGSTKGCFQRSGNTVDRWCCLNNSQSNAESRLTEKQLLTFNKYQKKTGAQVSLSHL